MDKIDFKKLTEDELHKEVYELLEKIEVLKTENKRLTEKNDYLIDTLLDLEEKMDYSESSDSDNINIDEPPNVSASCMLEEKKN
jgi:predicted nuclease with TOPRIM domain